MSDAITRPRDRRNINIQQKKNMENKYDAKAKPAFGFVIPTHLQTNEQSALLTSNVKSIRKLHPDAPIVLVNDRSPLSLPEFAKDCMVSIVESKYQGSAEMSAYEYFLRNPFCERMVMLHDSMTLTSALPFESLKTADILFIWEFTNHRVHWATIKEPESDYNTINNIITHDDLIMHEVNHEWDTTPEFRKWFKMHYHDKQKWTGCFGIMSVISFEFLVKLDQGVHIEKLAKATTDRRRRCAAESLFALSAMYVKGTPIPSLAGLYYDGLQHSNGFVSKHFHKHTFCR